MDVVPDREEQFRQFQATHLERQTSAAEQTARHASAIHAIVLLWLVLTLIGAVVLWVVSSQS